MNVVLAYYHDGFMDNGFVDSGSKLLDVCDSDKTAELIISNHKKTRDKECGVEEYEKWWTETVEVKTGDKES